MHKSVKISVVGYGGTGKTSLISRFKNNHFAEFYDPTIEDAYQKQIPVDGVVAFLDIFDLHGMDDYSSLRDQWCTEADAFIIVYNMCSKRSFEELDQFYQSIIKFHKLSPKPIVLVATHSDLPEHTREVSTAQGSELAKSWGSYSSFFEVSNKERINIDEPFIQVVRLVRAAAAPKASQPKANKSPGCSIM